MRSATRGLFAIDPRSLAAFRIAIGAVLLIDLGIRAVDLGVMYTDDGMFSRTTICRHYSSWNWSFHFGGGSWPYQALLFALAAAFNFALMIGYETRLATVCSWLMLVSLHNRVPLVLTGADNLARLLLFWGMFLPLGTVWSIDAWSAKRRGIRWDDASPVLSVATAAILLQIAFVYLFSAVFKTNADWFHGKALAAVLTDGFFGKPLSAALLGFPRILAVLTVTTLAMEWLGPFLLFSPLRTASLRLSVIGFLTSMHVGVAVLLNVGLFPAVSLSGLLLYLPPSFWEALARRVRGGADESGRLNALGTAAPGTAPLPVSLAAQTACGLALAYVLFANLNELPSHLLLWKPLPRTEFLTVSCGLGQKWDMFAEAPTRNGWYVARATLADGTEVDLLREGAPVVWTRPYDPAAIYPNHRWQKLFLEMSYSDLTGFEVFSRPVAEYLGRAWNRSRPSDKRVSDVSLVFCMEDRNRTSLGLPPATKRATFAHLDFPGDKKR